MAQTARRTPLPETGSTGEDTSEWMHDLTPTLSDEAMFDEDGQVQPLQVWPTEFDPVELKPNLQLVSIKKNTPKKA